MFDLLRDTIELDEATANALFDDYAEAIAAAEAKEEIDGVIDLSSICSGTLRLHEGDLSLDALHLTAESPSLFVEGNVQIRGLLQQDFRAGFLVVFGDLEAGDIATTAQIFVTGNLTVRGTLYGNCTNYMTSVLGHTRAKVLVSAKEHYFCLYGGRTIERIVDVYGDTPNLDDRTDGEEALVGGIDDGFDEGLVADRLRRGEPIVT
ncbi:MAG: hypothetical protein R3B48_15500 [Kofleriaceae bacterium]